MGYCDKEMNKIVKRRKGGRQNEAKGKEEKRKTCFNVTKGLFTAQVYCEDELLERVASTSPLESCKQALEYLLACE